VVSAPHRRSHFADLLLSLMPSASHPCTTQGACKDARPKIATSRPYNSTLRDAKTIRYPYAGAPTAPQPPGTNPNLLTLTTDPNRALQKQGGPLALKLRQLEWLELQILVCHRLRGALGGAWMTSHTFRRSNSDCKNYLERQICERLVY
jgi:hypothetical protein